MAEVVITIYQAGVAAIFWFVPSILTHHVYDPMTELLAPRQWAIAIWLITLGHVCAIYLNGSVPRISAPVRLVSSLCHAWVVWIIASSFWAASAYWPVWTYLGLIGFLLWGAVSTALDDLWRETRGAGDA